MLHHNEAACILQLMSARANSLLHQIQSLPIEDVKEFSQQFTAWFSKAAEPVGGTLNDDAQLTAGVEVPASPELTPKQVGQLEALKRLYGSAKGSRLLAKLLESRAEEREFELKRDADRAARVS